VNKARKTAFRAALEAGSIITAKLGAVSTVDYKKTADFVTDVDRAAEARIIEILRSEFPADAVLAEESGSFPGLGSDRCWIVDPLDGTTNFAHSYPFFAVSIALEEQERRILGVVFNPITDELFWAEPGEGAWLNDEPISVSKVKTLQESLLATGFPRSDDELEVENMRAFHNLTRLSHGVRRDGSAALDLCYVACGRLDGYWEFKLSPWDMGAGSLIIEEAGGRISDLVDGDFNLHAGVILASNHFIHEEMVLALNADG
jgi:myo-inositol-1(or 4)-monophosphatase